MKTCTKCNVEKTLDEYYRRALSKDGHDSECKVCRKRYDRGRKDSPDRRAMKYRATKLQREKCPEKYKAHLKVKRAVKSGKLEKRPCACGEKEVEAHHEDYSKPLEVIWKCSKCHRRHHAEDRK